MRSTIEVRRASGDDLLTFDVTVIEGGSRTTHRVTVETSRFERLSHDDESPEDFIRRCFDFLLAREPKESIMASFDVSVIGRYFPQFEEEIAR